jgi:DNA-binding transcriptional ArsR family regulator
MVDARLFQALSDPTRLDILALLARGTVNVSRMVAHLGCAQPAVSRHLRVLREAELITDKRKGKEVEYSLNAGALAAAAAYLRELADVEPAATARQQDVRPARSAGSPRARTKVPVGGRRRATNPERTARQPLTQPPGDFASKEGDFVIGPRRKSGLDDFLL